MDADGQCRRDVKTREDGPLFDGGAMGYRFDGDVTAMTRAMLEDLLARRDELPQPVEPRHWTG